MNTAYQKLNRKSSSPKTSILKNQSNSVHPDTPQSPLIQLQRNLGNQSFQHYIQPKLNIGKPNDKYEQEADDAAEQVMSMTESQLPEVRGQKSEASKDNAYVQKNPG